MLETAKQFQQVGMRIPTFFIQGPVDPDHNFNRDHNRNEKFLSRVRKIFFKQGLLECRSIKVRSKKIQQSLHEKTDWFTTKDKSETSTFRQNRLTFRQVIRPGG